MVDHIAKNLVNGAIRLENLQSFGLQYACVGREREQGTLSHCAEVEHAEGEQAMLPC